MLAVSLILLIGCPIDRRDIHRGFVLHTATAAVDSPVALMLRLVIHCQVCLATYAIAVILLVARWLDIANL